MTVEPRYLKTNLVQCDHAGRELCRGPTCNHYAPHIESPVYGTWCSEAGACGNPRRYRGVRCELAPYIPPPKPKQPPRQPRKPKPPRRGLVKLRPGFNVVGNNTSPCYPRPPHRSEWFEGTMREMLQSAVEDYDYEPEQEAEGEDE